MTGLRIVLDKYEYAEYTHIAMISNQRSAPNDLHLQFGLVFSLLTFIIIGVCTYSHTVVSLIGRAELNYCPGTTKRR